MKKAGKETVSDRLRWRRRHAAKLSFGSTALAVAIAWVGATATAPKAEQGAGTGHASIARIAEPVLLWETFSARFAVRPATISYTGDGTGIVTGSAVTRRKLREHDFGHIRWNRWSYEGANGRGLLWRDDCEPDCARGSFHSRPVRVRAFRVRGGRYTRMTFTTPAVAGGGFETTVLRLKHLTRASFVWDFS